MDDLIGMILIIINSEPLKIRRGSPKGKSTPLRQSVLMGTLKVPMV